MWQRLQTFLACYAKFDTYSVFRSLRMVRRASGTCSPLCVGTHEHARAPSLRSMSRVRSVLKLSIGAEGEDGNVLELQKAMLQKLVEIKDAQKRLDAAREVYPKMDAVGLGILGVPLPPIFAENSACSR